MYTYRVHHLDPDDIKEISHGLSTMVIALKRKKGLHEVYIQPNDVLQLGDMEEVKVNRLLVLIRKDL